MSALSEHTKLIGGLSSQISSTSPPKTIIYKDAVGLLRVAGSGVVIAGQPEALTGMTIITEPDRGKTG